ncbi:hypothetical protein OAO87_01485 [bacterium]|nr:hypothetical protein [bacterium]
MSATASRLPCALRPGSWLALVPRLVPLAYTLAPTYEPYTHAYTLHAELSSCLTGYCLCLSFARSPYSPMNIRAQPSDAPWGQCHQIQVRNGRSQLASGRHGLLSA